MATPTPGDIVRPVQNNKTTTVEREKQSVSKMVKPSFDRKPHLTDHPFRNHVGLQALKAALNDTPVKEG